MAHSNMTKAVEKAWAIIRERSPDVPDARIVIAQPRRKGISGHYAHHAWNGRGEAIGSNVSEVLISGAALDGGGEQVIETLIHESVHGIADTRQIQDTSRQGRYHNREFRKLAEGIGLTVESDKRCGCVTELSDKLREQFADTISELDIALTHHRPDDRVPSKPRAKWAMECQCEPPRRITKPRDGRPLICADCQDGFQELRVDS